jgi:hypothetical protein
MDTQSEVPVSRSKSFGPRRGAMGVAAKSRPPQKTLCDDRPMRETERLRPRTVPVCVVAPTLTRARAAISEISQSWDGALEPATLTKFLARRRSIDFLLCPEGRDLSRDLSFLREARSRMLWRAPDEDLHAAIAGLRGEEVGLLSRRARQEGEEGRRRALLLEGVVDAQRARAALASDLRQWIVESPFAVRLSARERQRLEKAGVSWFALAPARLVALVASPKLARERRQWRALLPPRTKVIVIES